MTRAILSCSPHFTSLALNELKRPHAHLSILDQLTPGHFLVQVPYSFDKLTQPWRRQLPIYLHHLFPVHAVLALDGTLDDLPLLKQAVSEIMPDDAQLQVRLGDELPLPYSTSDIQRTISGDCGPVAGQAPTGRVVSLLVVQEAAGLRAYAGISWATQNLSPWPGGHLPIREVVANRAGYKLLEALDVFGIRLRGGEQALDLGAAPGAWTTILRRRGLGVTTVAPAPLYPWLVHDAGVKHFALRAEDYLNGCQTTFDLIVNDMKLDVQDSARLMVAYARHLRAEGLALMTFKLRERNPQRAMDHGLRLLRKAYKIIRIRQLVHNRNEVTLFLRRKG
ncbi:MAG: SAM-dependent methyltransferase [Anaerolineae bacterium]